jgi:hypothetical protein
MKKAIIVVLSFIGVVVARAADLCTTFYFAPALQGEANPLVSLGGISWTGLILTQTAILCLVATALWYYGHGRTKGISRSVKNAWDFAPLCLYNREVGRSQFLCALLTGMPRFQKDWHQHLRLYGLVVAWGVIAASFFATMSWWLNHYFNIQWFQSVYHSIRIGNYPLLVIVAGLIGAAAGQVFFFSSEMREANKAVLPDEKKVEPTQSKGTKS